jgi:hypothetical protein
MEETLPPELQTRVRSGAGRLGSGRPLRRLEAAVARPALCRDSAEKGSGGSVRGEMETRRSAGS